MAICNGDKFVEMIEATECIGNSLVKINNNFEALDVVSCRNDSVVSALLALDGIVLSNGDGTIVEARPGFDFYLPGQAMNWDVTIFGSATISNNVTLLNGANLRLLNGDVLCTGASCVTLAAQAITCTGNTTTYGNLDVGRNALIGQDMTISNNLVVGGTSRYAGKLTANGGIDVVGNVKVTGVITATGNVQAFTSSDERLKKDITIIPNALEKVSSLRGVEFEWDENLQPYHQGKDVGVIAQEVEQVMPTAVKDGEDGYKSVQYDRMIPLLIEAVKELKEQNVALKAEIEALKSK
jgi:hypothetical protein